MPYPNITGAKEAGFPTKAEGISLTLPQINKLAEIYDSIKARGEADNPMAVAWTQWKEIYKKEDNKWVKREENMVELEREVFATGTWNGHKYTEEDLQELADNFKELYEKNVLKPPLRLGHTKDQKLIQKDGFPSAGWVSGLKKVGDKLIATISDIPNKIAELIKKKAYRPVSCGIVWNGTWGGKKYRRVLEHIALLGADIPAVASLDDWKALYEMELPDEFSQTEESGLYVYTYNLEENQRGKGKGIGGKPQGDGGAKYCVCPECGYSEEHKSIGESKTTSCTEIKCPKCGEMMQGSDTKELEKKEKKEEEMERMEELEKENQGLKTEKDNFKKEAKEAKEALETATKKQEENEIDIFVKGLITDGKILPKEAEFVKENLLLRNNTEKTRTYTIDDGKGKKEELSVTARELYMKELDSREKNSAVKLNELSRAGKKTEKVIVHSKDDTPIDESESKIAGRAEEIMKEAKDKGQEMSYKEALNRAYAEQAE